MKLFLIFITLSFAVNSYSQQTGTYYKKRKDFTYSLTLNSDSTFNLREAYFEVNAKYQGKWEKISGSMIMLHSSENTLEEKLQSGYISKREIKIYIISENKLELNKIIMRKH
ncbi:MAG: hypothetical protein ABI091_20275 [Ferruginibacter sp.]